MFDAHRRGRGKMTMQSEIGKMQPLAGTRNWKRQALEISLRTPEGIWPHGLISDLCPPEPGDNTFLLFYATKFVVVYYGSTSKLIHSLYPVFSSINGHMVLLHRAVMRNKSIHIR